jgi:hypothetical protein
MKFLVFNLVVAGALIYLVTGGDLSRLPSSGETAHRVTNTAKLMVDRGHDLANKVIGQIGRTDNTPRRDENGKAATALVEPGASAKVIRPVHQPNFNPPTVIKGTRGKNNQIRTPTAPVKEDSKKQVSKTAVASPNMPSSSDPAVLRRRAEVLAEGPIQKAADAPHFMSLHDRRRELHALTEEMELLFAQTMAR